MLEPVRMKKLVIFSTQQVAFRKSCLPQALLLETGNKVLACQRCKASDLCLQFYTDFLSFS